MEGRELDDLGEMRMFALLGPDLCDQVEAARILALVRGAGLRELRMSARASRCVEGARAEAEVDHRRSAPPCRLEGRDRFRPADEVI